MITNLIFHSLGLFFAFYLLNHSDLFAPFRDWLFPKLYSKIAYAATCSLCFSWWCMVAEFLIRGIPGALVVTVPICTLFLNLAYLNLKGVCED